MIIRSVFFPATRSTRQEFCNHGHTILFRASVSSRSKGRDDLSSNFLSPSHHDRTFWPAYNHVNFPATSDTSYQYQNRLISTVFFFMGVKGVCSTFGKYWSGLVFTFTQISTAPNLFGTIFFWSKFVSTITGIFLWYPDFFSPFLKVKTRFGPSESIMS